MANPWSKDREQTEQQQKTSQVSPPGDSNAVASSLDPGYQVSNLPLDQVGAPLGTNNIISPPPSLDHSMNTNPGSPGAEISYPPTNPPGSDSAQGNVIASSEFSSGLGDSGLWQKEKRNSRTLNQRKKRTVTGEMK